VLAQLVDHGQVHRQRPAAAARRRRGAPLAWTLQRVVLAWLEDQLELAVGLREPLILAPQQKVRLHVGDSLGERRLCQFEVLRGQQHLLGCVEVQLP